jgi:hypothetical protein
LSGATDLEAPGWVVDAWGSAALFEIATPDVESKSEEFKVTIPTHLRYRTPTNSTVANGLRSHPIPNPIVFWACTAESGTQFTTSPFDRRNLGYDALFGERTMFYHFNPDTPSSYEVIFKQGGFGGLVTYLDVPVLDLNRTSRSIVEWGTVGVIVLGTVWVCWALVKVFLRDPTTKEVKRKAGKIEKKDE